MSSSTESTVTPVGAEQPQQQQQQQQQQPQQEQQQNVVLSSVIYGVGRVYAGAVYVGETLADLFGLTESKYQFHLDEHNMKQEEKKKKMEREGIEISKLESGESTSKGNDNNSHVEG
ncbi:hypothetical protein SAMD00019534_073250 [Acytostelium subglobosum LB1]|uniref:hypothetical protein n=1 Tax=Acytostelium subglobosum LB1 TaxID=1410327 RepID=UPI000644A9F7|nr:hypothetical protein SAMD00019534_073250 [Acytostelium subglobosum LB1]GAM24150.1 hypothetical protein SAMD00019534_073250 [Acytostelium subglobosum LB1]|eukprot:XP_012753186.1 hypothetical protein SAMD00019534_073250 [Acytostelium subglobosum LB1]